MVYVILGIAAFITGFIIGRHSVVGRANGAARAVCNGTESGDAQSAERAQQLEQLVERAESANAEAIKTIKGIQDLITSVRECNSRDNNI